ncbi:hypothetical protein GCM10010193_33070 [Kitasatospora atroaurantiaca]|uniref:Uncharacterized protein n=1 Tax=Kitasatospora atroaurantiaca TaxID=285545 RepID=A0A561ERP4_9ACTN|nr:hypothetical protein [Kitasatospora atroaurantiaca]TWE18282.1 hypothetical protein FB465_3343 [Kitasatospora atroaurantiaca]
MNRARESVEIGLVFSDPDGAETTEREMESLIEELDQLPLLHMEHTPAPPAPHGTRAGDVTVYSSIVLGLAGAPAVRSLILLVQDWLARRTSGAVTLRIGDSELALEAGSPAERRRIVEAFLAHLASTGRAEDSDG